LDGVIGIALPYQLSFPKLRNGTLIGCMENRFARLLRKSERLIAFKYKRPDGRHGSVAIH
jgi:hypothetical protein